MSSVITQPTKEPVTLAEAKRQCQVQHDDDDILLTRLIMAARSHVESITESSLVRQVRRKYFDSFCDSMRLDHGPVQDIAQVQYVDADGATQTASSSLYELSGSDDVLLRAYGQTWPSTQPKTNAVWVEYYAGYYDASESPVNIIKYVPEALKHAVLLLVSDMYENREVSSDIQLYKNPAFDMLVAPWRKYLQ